MCGIAGFVTRDNQLDLREDLETAVERLSHRGPDDHGTWFNNTGTGLGHRRLSILDLSAHGHQPIATADGRFTMVFNGEIYNFADIRKTLIEKGYAFAGTGDTAVVLASFQEWGDAAVDRFIGMFTVAVWDQAERRLLLVRDRVGIKPLYYGWDGRTLWFASELKGLRAFRHWRPQVDMRAVGEFLQYGYISSARSIYQNVYKLEPGHHLTLEADVPPKVERYWSVINNATAPASPSEDAVEAELEELLTDACQYRMISDVPVGVYLSGGIDSSVVTALLARKQGRSLRTFTIGFSEAKHDESVWARRVAEHLGTEHTEYILGVEEALDLARRWGDLFDEPFADASGIPTYLVSRLASQEVKVVLSADGGDELFSGYQLYPDVLGKWQRLASVPGWLRVAGRSSLAAVPVGTVDRLMSVTGLSADQRGWVGRRIKRLRTALANPTPGSVYDASIAYWLPEDIRRLIGDYEPPRPPMDLYDGDPAEQMCLWDLHHYLPEDILTKVDRTTMAVSIEGREPLLDHRVVEYAFGLPLNLRRGALGSKHILKKILYRHVPREFVDRPKQGFSIPLDEWLREDLKTLVHDHLEPDRIRNAGVFDPDIVAGLVKNYYDGDRNVVSMLWFMLTFEMWREKWG